MGNEEISATISLFVEDLPREVAAEDLEAIGLNEVELLPRRAGMISGINFNESGIVGKKKRITLQKVHNSHHRTPKINYERIIIAKSDKVNNKLKILGKKKEGGSSALVREIPISFTG